MILPEIPTEILSIIRAINPLEIPAGIAIGVPERISSGISARIPLEVLLLISPRND